MNFILTLVAARAALSAGHLADIAGVLADMRIRTAGDPYWLDKNKAADIPVSARPDKEGIFRLRRHLAEHAVDFFITPAAFRQKKLLLCDMDDTIVDGETLDMLAEHKGIGPQITVITQQAMRGELDFKTALERRIALLAGLPETAMAQTLSAMRLTPGAQAFVQGMRGRDVACVLVSGGFTYFTAAIAARAGFQQHHGNTLEIREGELTGRVLPPILDKNAKRDYLIQYRESMGLKPEEVMAVGDGANDLPMLLEAGLGIGFRPKPLLLEQLDNCIIHGDLTAALYAQGFGNIRITTH